MKVPKEDSNSIEEAMSRPVQLMCPVVKVDQFGRFVIAFAQDTIPLPDVRRVLQLARTVSYFQKLIFILIIRLLLF